MKNRLRLFLLMITALAGWGVLGVLAAQERPPLVLVTIDTLRADHLPMWGAEDVSTPHLQALAERSVIFEQAVTSVPLTLPAHASLLTGTYPQFHQLRTNSSGRLSQDIPTLAEMLKSRGYKTGAFVASAVLDRRYGLDRGFDHYGDQFGLEARYAGKTAERTAEAVMNEALKWMGSHSGPIFVWIHLYDPHAPYQAPGRHGGRGYKGEIEYVDTQIGRLRSFLKGKGWDKRAMVAVLSDHGEDLGQHGEPTHGFFVYDTVMRIPLLMKFPGDEHAGKRVSRQVRIIDVLPTLLRGLDVPLPRQSVIQGSGLLPLVLGKERGEMPAYGESLYARVHFGWSRLFALRTGQWKYIQAPRPELYDLEEDPGETRNLFESRQGMANRLGQTLRELRVRYQGSRDQAEPVDIDPQQRQRLESLGYLSTSAPVDLSGQDEDLPDPKDKIEVYASIYRGMQGFVEDRLKASLNHLLKAAQTDPSMPTVHDYLGRVYSRLNRPREAIESYKKALKLSPGDLQVATNLAFAYLQADQPEEAVEGLEMLTQVNRSDWQSWHFLGVARTRLERWPAAAEAFAKALELKPGSKDVLFNLATSYGQQGEHEKAIQAFQRLVQLAPQDPQALGGLATHYEAAGKEKEAYEAYRKAIQVAPDDAAGYFNLGNFFARRGGWEDAEKFYRDAIERQPDFAQAYMTLSVVLHRQGKVREAAEWEQKARRLMSPPR
ncbi:MAG TPA: sulfatase-like hydrolase/transferase [Acidobacteriota bacterium]|nr:sulfatase-like hydrolase/transferase [Acidobacteriota bacterium]